MLVVVIAGELIGNHTPDGCHSCLEPQPLGTPMVMVDDGEYDYTFCTACITAVVAKLQERIQSSVVEGPPGSTAPA